MKEKELFTLNHLQKLSSKNKKSFIRTSIKFPVSFISECAINVLNGNVPVNVKKLMKFEDILQILISKTKTEKQKRASLSTTQGIKLIELLYIPCEKHLQSSLL